jgi:hypothetical protein
VEKFLVAYGTYLVLSRYQFYIVTFCTNESGLTAVILDPTHILLDFVLCKDEGPNLEKEVSDILNDFFVII